MPDAKKKKRELRLSAVKGNSFFLSLACGAGLKARGLLLCSNGNLSDCYVGKKLTGNQREQNYRQVISISFRLSWYFVMKLL